MEGFLIFVVVSILVESFTEHVKLLVGKKVPEEVAGVPVFMWVSLIIGVILAVMLKIDIFGLIGLNFEIKVVGWVLTGLLLSRGSNYVFALLKRVKSPIPETPVTIEITEPKNMTTE